MTEADTPNAESSARPNRQMRYALLASSAAIFAVQLDFFSVQAGIPAMAEDLGVTTTTLQWVISGYMLAVAAFLIVGGRLGDIFGRRRWLIIGAAVFGLASAVGGAAPSEAVLIGARVVQGVGGAILFPLALAVTTNAFASGNVQRAVGLVLAIGAIGQAFGPILGGLLTEFVSWRAVLWVNVPIAALAIFFAWRGVAESRDDSVPRSIDWVGVIIIAASAATLTLGFDQAASWGWLDLRTLGLIALGVLGLVAFVVVESRVSNPLLDLELFRIRAYTAVSTGGALGTTSVTIVIFLAMVFFQDVEGLTALQAGLAFVTFAIGYALGALASGRFGEREPWLVMTAALALGGLGVIGLGLSIGYTPAFVVIGLFAGTGLGLAFNYLNVVSQAVVPARLAGGASGTALTMLVISGAIALAIGVSVFDTLSAQSDLSESNIISIIFVASGLVSLASAGLVAALGREPRPDDGSTA